MALHTARQVQVTLARGPQDRPGITPRPQHEPYHRQRPTRIKANDSPSMTSEYNHGRRSLSPQMINWDKSPTLA
jgi:hypothetical protein